jgi:CubicO group peptidase (beta-lactamase class C family)
MTSGLDWGEWEYPYGDPRNPSTQMYRSEDPVQFVLDRPMKSEPGVEWFYNSGGSHLLSALIQKYTEMTTLEFANRYLFEPLGIYDVSWNQDVNGICAGGGGLSLRPRDMAKFGYLYLNDGVWDGRQIVSSNWTKNSTKSVYPLGNLTPEWNHAGYGYQWWTIPSLGVFYALGYRGQKIYVFPAYDMIVVFTALLSDTTTEDQILTKVIIPSIIDEEQPIITDELLTWPLFIILSSPCLLAIFLYERKVRTNRMRCN